MIGLPVRVIAMSWRDRLLVVERVREALTSAGAFERHNCRCKAILEAPRPAMIGVKGGCEVLGALSLAVEVVRSCTCRCFPQTAQPR